MLGYGHHVGGVSQLHGFALKNSIFNTRWRRDAVSLLALKIEFLSAKPHICDTGPAAEAKYFACGAGEVGLPRVEPGANRWGGPGGARALFFVLIMGG